MAYVVAASLMAVVVGLVYLGSVWAAFRQVRSDRKAEWTEGRSEDAPSGSSEGEAEPSFSWKALISIGLSSVILYVAGKSAVLWNYIPFIAIGTAIAVIVAFSIDLRRNT